MAHDAGAVVRAPEHNAGLCREQQALRCCPTPGVGPDGHEVEWGLRPLSAEARAFLAEPLGTQIAEQLTHGETHHEGADDEPTVPTRGRIESIQAVHWRVAPRSRSKPRVLYPVAGTGV